MSDNLSRGPLQVLTGDVLELNDVFRRIRQELDEVQGLNGRALLYDRVAVGTPSAVDDAAQLGSIPTGFVTINTTQTITGLKTLSGVAFRLIDSSSTLIHAWGTKT